MRMSQGKKVWQAHRDHAYQRLNMNGFGHRNTALLYYGLMLASALVALFSLQPDAGWAVTAGLLTVFLLAYGIVQRFWNRRQLGVSPSHADDGPHKTPEQ
jgi:hypothetical protein